MGKLKTLQAHPFFKGLTALELAVVSTIVVPTTHKKNDVLFRAQEASDATILVLSGEAQIIVEQSGRPKLTTTVKAFEVLGEMALLGTSGEHLATATVKSAELKALTIRSSDMQRLIQARPQIAAKLMNELRERLAEKVAALTL